MSTEDDTFNALKKLDLERMSDLVKLRIKRPVAAIGDAFAPPPTDFNNLIALLAKHGWSYLEYKDALYREFLQRTARNRELFE